MASTVAIQQEIQRLTARIAALEAAYDIVCGQPSSVSIAGAMQYTHLSPATLRAEIKAWNRKLSRLMGIRRTVTLPLYQRGNTNPTGYPQ